MRKLVFRGEKDGEKLLIYDISHYVDPGYYSFNKELYLLYYENLNEGYFDYCLLTEAEAINEEEFKRLFDGLSGDSFDSP